MSASPTPSNRLIRLDRILSQSPPAVASRSGDTDPAQVHLTGVPLDRIRALTIELQDRATTSQDDIDAITMRLLLNDYQTAVTHLRAVANAVDTRLHAASDEINHTRKALRREQEMAAKRGARDAEDAG